MAMLGASDSSTAIQDAMNKLRAASTGGGGAAQAAVSPYRIPVKTGAQYNHPSNRGQFDDDIHTVGKTVNEKRDVTDYFDLTDEGVNAAIGSWYTFDDDERSALMKKMWFLGLIKDPSDFDGAYRAWQVAVGHAARFADTGKEIDPRDVLDMLGDSKAGAGTKQKAGPITRRQIDLTNPETAKAWITQAFAQSMGRAPEDAEVRALADALNERERANPTVQTTTPTKWDDQGNAIDSTTSTTGGFDSSAYLQNQISSDPEATAHQAAGELYPALLAALGGGLS